MAPSRHSPAFGFSPPPTVWTNPTQELEVGGGNTKSSWAEMNLCCGYLLRDLCDHRSILAPPRTDGATNYRMAMGLPGDPVAPLSGTGVNTNANSYTASAASVDKSRFSML